MKLPGAKSTAVERESNESRARVERLDAAARSIASYCFGKNLEKHDEGESRV